MELASVTTSPEAEGYFELTADELNDMVAECHGWTKRNVAFEWMWMDENDVCHQLASVYKPATNIIFALELLKEMAEEGYGVAINTKDVVTGEDVLLVGGFGTKPENKPLPQIRVELEEGSLYKKELCKAIAILYIASR